MRSSSMNQQIHTLASNILYTETHYVPHMTLFGFTRLFGFTLPCLLVIFFYFVKLICVASSRCIVQVCFLPGTLALGATKGITKKKAMEENLLTFEDLENLKLAEDLAKTCFEMYSVTTTGLAPEIAYFNVDVSWFLYLS